jgi:hypothetical protein
MNLNSAYFLILKIIKMGIYKTPKSKLSEIDALSRIENGFLDKQKEVYKSVAKLKIYAFLSHFNIHFFRSSIVYLASIRLLYVFFIDLAPLLDFVSVSVASKK